MAILVLVSKKALANCSPSTTHNYSVSDTENEEIAKIKSPPRSVLSMMLKFEMFERKSAALGA